MDRNILTDFLLKNSSTLFLVVDQDGKIQYYNEFAARFIGEDKLNSLKDVIIDPHDKFSMDAALENEKSYYYSVNNIYNDPQTFRFSFIKNTEAIYIFGESNFEESRKIQKEMIVLNNEYADLTRELFKKNRELKDLDEMKNQFLGIAAHDLRNPFGNIIAIAHLLNDELEDKLNPELKKLFLAISRLGQFGLNLLNDLLDYSRIESGEKKLNLTKTDPVRLIKEIVNLNSYFASTNNVALVFQPVNTIRQIKIDTQAFQQILNNLISNAIKYSPKHSKVEVGIIPEEGFYTFYVKDEGPGIPEKEQEKLFKPFFTTSVKPRNNEKSTGLGLWIVNMLVEIHGGKVWIDSEVGKGTAIYFSIPV